MEKWKLLNSEEILSSRWVTVKKNDVLIPPDTRIPDFYSVTISDAAGIVAVTEKGTIILKREYRFCQDEELIEIPAGVFEPEEHDPLTVAKRELLEETGYESDEWTYLGATVESSSKLTNKMHLFPATNCRKVGDQRLDRGEVVEVL